MIGSLASPVAAWLLTYLAHSTLLLGGAWLLTRYVIRRESLRETLWKTALVGGLVTATAAMALPRPGALRVELAALSSPTTVAPTEARGERPSTGESDAALSSPLEGERAPASTRGLQGGTAPEAEEAGAAAREAAGQPVREAADQPAGEAGDAGGDSATGAPAAGAGGGSVSGSGVTTGGLLRAGITAWLLIALALLGRLGYRHVRLRLLLRDREQVAGTEAAASVLTELRRSAGVWKPVRLTSSPSVATPLALGTEEICVPARFLEELDAAEQRAALAHELAHLARRDPVWQVAGAVIGAVFFFQPLNRAARRAIRAAAEYLADGWAVAQTGSQVELARCLASVAGWVAPSSEPALAGTVAMAEGGSPLMVRVQRLLEHEPEESTAAGLRLALAVAVLAVAAGFAPVVGAAGSAETSTDWNTDSSTDTNRSTDTDSNASSRTEADTSDQESLDVRRLDRPATEGDGFVARLNEAGRDAAGSPYWVAYAIESDAREARIIDSDVWSNRELEGPRLAERLGVSEEQWAALSRPVVVLVRLVPDGPAARVDRIAVRRPELGARVSGTVYWLGLPTVEESFRWFRDIYIAVGDADIREAAVDVIGVHRLPAARDFLHRVLAEDENGPVRGEAVEGLARLQQDTALARLLFDVALTDPDGGVRHQAAEALGRMEPGLAVELLTRLARESSDEDVQQQAAESLADVGTPAALRALDDLIASGRSEDVRREALDQRTRLRGPASGEALVHMAMTDDEPNLRREAVELIGELPSDQAVPLLRRVAFESGDGTAERQAAETLGRVGTGPALEVLREILERNPSEDASFQAVEAVAENFPRSLALPLLRHVLETHPSSRVRREALDRLGDLGG